MNASQHCEYCGKQAVFMCGDCMIVAYCSREHQIQHWRIHKQHCNILKAYRLRSEENQLNVKRLDLRKKFFDNFSHKVFDSCIKIAEELVELQVNYIQNTRQIFNELQYGISMCLLARCWLIVQNAPKTVIIIKNYVQQKYHFLQDMRDIFNIQDLIKKQSKKNNQNFNLSSQRSQNSTPLQSPTNAQLSRANTELNTNLKSTHSVIRQFSIKKVSLIASVANILYAVGLPVIKMYEMYTEHIQKMFGRQSLQASNCYFMIGSHFMENNQCCKSIACFMRAAELRGNMAGDCYYNLGIIYQLLSKHKISLKMFENAAKLRENQFGQNSAQVADVYHNIAIIYQSLGNFKGAIENLQKIALIYSKDKNSQEYKNAKQSIKILQQSFKKHMEKIDDKSIGMQIMKDLKKSIRKASKLSEQQPLSDRSIRSKSDKQKDLDKDKVPIQNNYLKVTNQFLDRLNPLQTMYLSELQVELSQCQSMFMAATTVGNSIFLKALKNTKLQHLIRDNQNLFKHITLQKLSRRNQKDRRLE